MSDTIKLLLHTILLATLTILPIALFSGHALRTKKNLLVSISFGTILSGLLAYICFWTYFVSPEFGLIFKSTILALLFLLSVFHGKSRQGLMLFNKEFGLIFALWFLFSLFILSAGLAPDGNFEVLANLRSRLSHNLPEDNALQYIFAVDIVRGNIPHPMLWDWLSSDRPPLGTAFVLLFSSNAPNELDYQIESTLLQCLWLCGLWIFLRAYKTNALAIAVVLLTTMFSGLAIVNGIYVWPKLLPVCNCSAAGRLYGIAGKSTP